MIWIATGRVILYGIQSQAKLPSAVGAAVEGNAEVGGTQYLDSSTKYTSQSYLNKRSSVMLRTM